MNKFALVENGQVIDTFSSIPKSYKNISGFDLLGVEELKSHGFYSVNNVVPAYDKLTQKLSSPILSFDGSSVVETHDVIDMTYEEKLSVIYGLRQQEYPPASDYLDAIVKGDTVQQLAYIDACLAVKAKYPKPIS